MNPAVLALMIPIVAIVCGTILKLAGRRAGPGPDATPELNGRLEAVEHEIGMLRQELTETQERLDFTERLLADKSSGRQGDEGHGA